jgi:hypothetical protein
MSVQLSAVASQKFTVPTVSAVPPACTVAVIVSTLLAATVVTVPPLEVIARVVMVGVVTAKADGAKARSKRK